MAKPLGWPIKHERDYQLFVVEFEAIRQITSRIIRMSANGDGMAYYRRALPTILELGQIIKLHVADLEARKRGRWPYKINGLLEEIEMTAAHLTRRASEAHTFYVSNNFPALSKKVHAINEAAVGMLEELARHRVSFDLAPNALEQAAELVEQLTPDWER